MYSYLKAKNHKGISEIKLEDLGHINIICGKNNSGKTSILEALNNPKKFAIGKRVESKGWLEELFAPEADKYSTPNPRQCKNWFSQYISDAIEKQTIWYSDEYELILHDMHESMKKDPFLQSRNPNLFDINKLLNNFLNISKYKTILIPPKRNLVYEDQIHLAEESSPNGDKIANRLFFLKNQIPTSIEFKTYEKICLAFEQITGYFLNVVADAKNTIRIYFKMDGGEWLLGNDCGLGLSDILVMITFAIDSDCTLMLIEEPENHLHPEMQKKFLNFIKTINVKQFILSTHSNVFLDPTVVDKIFYIFFNNNNTVASDETSKSEILYNLGYSVADNLVADLVVLTEGPTDIPVLNTIFDWMGLRDKYNIRLWPLGGDIMSQLDLSIFTERNNVFALIDSDPGSSVIRTRFERICGEYGIKCHRLERYSLENYFTISAVRNVIPDIPETITEILPDKSINEQIGRKDQSIKSKNHKIIKFMSMVDIENTDLYSFCMEIKKFLDITQANNSTLQS